jgi:hypothetical protein
MHTKEDLIEGLNADLALMRPVMPESCGAFSKGSSKFSLFNT